MKIYTSTAIFVLIAGLTYQAHAMGRQSDNSSTTTNNPNGVSGRTDTSRGVYGDPVSTNRDNNATNTGIPGRPTGATPGSINQTGTNGTGLGTNSSGSMGAGSTGVGGTGTGAGAGTGGAAGAGAGAGAGGGGH